MLSKVFGSFSSNEEMRLVMFAITPLYSEQTYNADKGLENSLRTVFNAESHSTFAVRALPLLTSRRAVFREGEILRLPSEIGEHHCSYAHYRGSRGLDLPGLCVDL